MPKEQDNSPVKGTLFFIHEWSGAMSGALSVPFAAIAVFAPDSAKLIWFLLAYAALAYTVYSVRAKERGKSDTMKTVLEKKIAELEQKITGMENQRLAKREKVMLAYAPIIGVAKNPNIVSILLDTGISELESNDDVLSIIENINQESRHDWLWLDVLKYVPKEKMGYFFKKLGMTPINRNDPKAVGWYLRKILPELYAPITPPLPLPPPN